MTNKAQREPHSRRATAGCIRDRILWNDRSGDADVAGWDTGRDADL